MTSPAPDVLPSILTDYTYDSELDIADGVPLKHSDAARVPEGELVHAFMTSRLDYCNALLGGCPASSINKLQIVQNAAARVLTRSRKYDLLLQFYSLCTGYLLSIVSVTKYYYLHIRP